MSLALIALGSVFVLAHTVCFLFVLVHAFGRSVGTGFMVLCIPFYNLFYAFSQFEHRRKGLIVAGWLGFLVVGIVLRVVAFQLKTAG